MQRKTAITQKLRRAENTFFSNGFLAIAGKYAHYEGFMAIETKVSFSG